MILQFANGRTNGQTNGQTLVVVKSLSRLKSSKLCRAISQAQIDLFWKFKNPKSSIFNELHVYHAGMCHFGVFMVFLGTLKDTTMKNRVQKFMIFKNCNFFHTFFQPGQAKSVLFSKYNIGHCLKMQFQENFGGVHFFYRPFFRVTLIFRLHCSGMAGDPFIVEKGFFWTFF